MFLVGWHPSGGHPSESGDPGTLEQKNEMPKMGLYHMPDQGIDKLAQAAHCPNVLSDSSGKDRTMIHCFNPLSGLCT